MYAFIVASMVVRGLLPGMSPHLHYVINMSWPSVHVRVMRMAMGIYHMEVNADFGKSRKQQPGRSPDWGRAGPSRPPTKGRFRTPYPHDPVVYAMVLARPRLAGVRFAGARLMAQTGPPSPGCASCGMAGVPVWNGRGTPVPPLDRTPGLRYRRHTI